MSAPLQPDHEGIPCPNSSMRLSFCGCRCCYNWYHTVRDRMGLVYWKPHTNYKNEIQPCLYCDGLKSWYVSSTATPENKRGKADPETQYAFTLTMPPDYISKKPLDQVARLIVENGLTNKPYEKAIKWAFVLEHTEAGTPHVHGMYQTASGRRIAAKYFKRYHDLWDETVSLGHGHKGGYHQKARQNECYSAYMQKEGCVHTSEVISHV